MPVKWAERNRLATTQNPSIFNKWIDTKWTKDNGTVKIYL